MSRKDIPSSTQTELFWKSMRRCAICYGVENDFNEKPGQIAHLNQDNTQTNLNDLVWLCILHHDRYDSKTSQTKNFTKQEVSSYRSRLYKAVEKIREAKNPLNINPEKDATTTTLSLIFNHMPFTHLLEYIHNFPEFFSMRITEPSERWIEFARSNPHIYPFEDQNLNFHLNRFFSICEKLNTHLKSYIGDYPCFQPSIDYRGTNHNLGINTELDIIQATKTIKSSQIIKQEFTSAYKELVSYIRSSYPKTEMNGYSY